MPLTSGTSSLASKYASRKKRGGSIPSTNRDPKAPGTRAGAGLKKSSRRSSSFGSAGGMR